MRYLALLLVIATLTACGGGGALIPYMPPVHSQMQEPELRDDIFHQVKVNPVKLASKHPISTFSIDVDTTAYSTIRKMITDGTLPREDTVRVEEMVNYFSYNYPAPTNRAQPFKASVALYPTPWNSQTKLLHIGLKGYELNHRIKPRSNLVFLIDVSGSMDQPNKLPLVKKSLKLLVSQLGPNDSVSIVAYAGDNGVVLEPTKALDKAAIISAISNLDAHGATAGHNAMKNAYSLARSVYDPKAINRIILATDGDFNVGMSDAEALKNFIAKQRKHGIYLSVLGFGMGNYNDVIMQALAQNGNGIAAYIDNLKEAHKVLVEQASSTLFPIANDVKIQMEFNPAKIREYRLIGYETRQLKRQDFNNDKVDAGDIGAGHSVTAIYEIALTGSQGGYFTPLRYGKKQPAPQTENLSEYAFLKIKYKKPGGKRSILQTIPITSAHAYTSNAQIPADMRFAASVAAFGQKLSGGKYLQNYSYDEILTLAASGVGADKYGYRGEFMGLVRLAKTLGKISAN